VATEEYDNKQEQAIAEEWNTCLTLASSCEMASGADFDADIPVLDEQVAGQVNGRLSVLLATSLLSLISQDIDPSAETSDKLLLKLAKRYYASFNAVALSGDRNQKLS